MFSESFEVRGNERWGWGCKKATRGRGFLNPAKMKTECGALVWQTGALVRREETHRSHTLPRGHGRWPGLPSLQDYKEVTQPMVLTTVLSLTSVFFIALHGQGMRESWVSSSMTPCLFILGLLTEWAACCFCLVDWPKVSVPVLSFQTQVVMPAFLHGAGDSNSGLQACIARAFTYWSVSPRSYSV